MCPRGPLNMFGGNEQSVALFSQQTLAAWSSPAVVLTHRAVRSHPVGVTAAQPSVWYEGPMPVALVRALSPGKLAVEPSPAWFTVALPIHTDAIVGTCRIQAIHCINPEIDRREKINKLQEKNKWTKTNTSSKMSHQSRCWKQIKCYEFSFLRKRRGTGDIFILCVHKKIMI